MMVLQAERWRESNLLSRVPSQWSSGGPPACQCPCCRGADSRPGSQHHRRDPWHSRHLLHQWVLLTFWCGLSMQHWIMRSPHLYSYLDMLSHQMWWSLSRSQNNISPNSWYRRSRFTVYLDRFSPDKKVNNGEEWRYITGDTGSPIYSLSFLYLKKKNISTQDIVFSEKVKRNIKYCITVTKLVNTSKSPI